MKKRRFKNKALWKRNLSRALTKKGKQLERRKKQIVKGRNLQNENLSLQNEELRAKSFDRKVGFVKAAGGLGLKTAAVGGVAGGLYLGSKRIMQAGQKTRGLVDDINNTPDSLYNNAKKTAKKAQEDVVSQAANVQANVKQHYTGNFEKAKVNFQDELNKPDNLSTTSAPARAGRTVGRVYKNVVNKKNRDVATTQKLLAPVTTRIKDVKGGVDNFKVEANNINPDKNDPSFKRGYRVGKVFTGIKARAMKDSAARKRRLGFSSSNDFWIEFGKRKGLEDDSLIEFAKRKTRRGGSRKRKPLSAAHKAKISRALKKNDAPSEEEQFFKNQRKLATVGTVVAMGSQAANSYNNFRTGQVTRAAMKSGITDRRITSIGAGVGGIGVGVGSVARSVSKPKITPYQRQRLQALRNRAATAARNAQSYEWMARARAAAAGIQIPPIP